MPIVAPSITDIVRELARSLRDEGSLMSYLREILGMSPAAARVDCFTFAGTVAITSGAVTQPSTVRVHSDMDFAVFAIGGYIRAATTTPADFDLITFNIRESGAANDVFSTDVSMAALVGSEGQQPIYFPNKLIYKFGAGNDIKLTYKCTTAPSATRYPGVTLWGALVRRK